MSRFDPAFGDHHAVRFAVWNIILRTRGLESSAYVSSADDLTWTCKICGTEFHLSPDKIHRYNPLLEHNDWHVGDFLANAVLSVEDEEQLMQVIMDLR